MPILLCRKTDMVGKNFLAKGCAGISEKILALRLELQDFIMYMALWAPMTEVVKRHLLLFAGKLQTQSSVDIMKLKYGVTVSRPAALCILMTAFMGYIISCTHTLNIQLILEAAKWYP